MRAHVCTQSEVTAKSDESQRKEYVQSLLPFRTYMHDAFTLRRPMTYVVHKYMVYRHELLLSYIAELYLKIAKHL